MTNPGDVPFPATGVVVSDDRCDDPPELAEKQDGSGADDSPDTLDPGDTWVYRCVNRTAEPGNDCEPFRIDNTGTVTGSAGGTTVKDEDSASTILLCPSPAVVPACRRPTDRRARTESSEPGPVAPPGSNPS